MNELKKANKCIMEFIESGLGLENGISRIKTELHRVFRFYDEQHFSRQVLRESYEAFEVWLNNLMISRPPPDGLKALYFGLYDENGTIRLFVTGSNRWNMLDPGWAGDRWYMPGNDELELPVFKDISPVISEYNPTGLYLSITLLAVLMREYTASSMISLLDIRRTVLYLACGFAEGDLYNVGRLTEDGLEPPGRKRMYLS